MSPPEASLNITYRHLLALTSSCFALILSNLRRGPRSVRSSRSDARPQPAHEHLHWRRWLVDCRRVKVRVNSYFAAYPRDTGRLRNKFSLEIASPDAGDPWASSIYATETRA